MIKFGEKIQPWCEPDRCQSYGFVVDISNNAGIEGVFRCPKHYCDIVLARNNTKQKPPKQEEKIIIDNPGIVNGGLLENIEKYMLEKTKNQRFMVLYSDISPDGKYRFYNPFNSFADPLIIKEDTDFNEAIVKLDKFFDTMYKRG